MPRLILVTGRTGAGKTTYSLALENEIRAVRFSIDPWMQTLFGPDVDMNNPDYEWMIERVHRCYTQIWDIASRVLQLGGNVILDLGFTEMSQRRQFIDQASAIGVTAEVHYLKRDLATRRQWVSKRNREKDPQVFAFEVTSQMIEFMEPRFEEPTAAELLSGLQLNDWDSLP